ncbi:MAG: tail fiber domain-containing protein, partial [Pseudomonadota bacterium]|nr:tail fiber domain-containing protein [Pseudomonadota bacterium]
ERMRIHSNGQASFGTTDNGYGLTVINTSVQSNPTCFMKSEGFDNVEVLRLQNDRANSSSGVIAAMMLFYNGSGAKVGSIEGGTSTAYNTTSDYRLKENVVSISDGITRLKTLKPKRFNFIESPTVTVDGFLAHEVTAVPEAISGEKDAIDSNGEIDPQGLDQSKLVPLLTAALQEAVAKIEVLETKVAALEAASSN